MTAFHEEWKGHHSLGQEEDPDGSPGDVWHIRSLLCPECKGFVAELYKTSAHVERRWPPTFTTLVWPKSAGRPVPPEVDQRFALDFKEAVATLPVSPKASAALSRRLLQDILREKAGVKKPTLSREIDEVINAGGIPSFVTDNLHAIREVGNFAAHPTKDTNSGEIVEVEPGEAEFLLEVLEGLFDFYFVQPARAKNRRDEINAKLQAAGKPPLKP